MDPMEIMNALEKLDRQNQQENENNPWLIYVAEKGETVAVNVLKTMANVFVKTIYQDRRYQYIRIVVAIMLS